MMFWRPQTIVRHAVPSLSGRWTSLNPSSCAWYTSRFSSTSPIRAFNVNDMLQKALCVKGSPSGNKSAADMWASKSDGLKLPSPPDTWTGRRVQVKENNLQDAFQRLNLRLRQNHVAKEIALTVRHEKKGDKRARLRSERWRKRFADAACQKKGAIGQHDTSAGWLSEAVHALNASPSAFPISHSFGTSKLRAESYNTDQLRRKFSHVA